MKEGVSSVIDTDERYWSAATVAAAVEAKQNQRQQKARASNCFTVRYYDTDAPDGTAEKDKFELKNFLTSLKESIEAGKFDGNDLDTNRFQLLVQNGAHWTPFDITIKDGKLNVITLDAAGSPSEADSINLIKEQFPDSNFFWLSPDCASQMDNNSCSRFSLDMVFKMQNISDPISLLEAHTAESKAKVMNNYGEYTGKEVKLAPKDIPNEMAFLFRNVQSGTKLNELPDRLLDSHINKTQVTLRDYAEEHAQMVDVKGQQKKRYMAIETVKTKLSDNTNNYLAGISEDKRSQIREKAKGTEFISASKAERQQMNQAQIQSVAPQKQKVNLAKEAIRTTPKKTGMLSYFSATNKRLREAEKIVSKAKKAEMAPVQDSPKESRKSRNKL